MTCSQGLGHNESTVARPALFEPITIGRLELKNRLVMAPMGTGYASPQGEVTDRLLSYYEERARGGVGLVIVEATCVEFPVAWMLLGQVRADDDHFLPGLKELAEGVHRQGAAVFIQLCHGGRVAKSRVHGVQPVAPSPLAVPGGEVPRELKAGEMPSVVRGFVQAALRAQKAGFDGIEVHAAHAYLLNNFLSPATNQRQDSYGGDLKGRARLLLEVLEGIRRAVGAGFVISCRINGAEYGLSQGITPQDSQALAPMIEAAGADVIHVSAFGYAHPVMRASTPIQPGFELPLAQGVKEQVRIPVIAVGRITPELAEKAILEGQADLISLARALLADPYLPNKVSLGREEDIRPCINCIKCRDGVVAGKPVFCAVNPCLGKEKELALTPARDRKRVLVVGGGVAGMEAARVAALRGHQVWLYEKSRALGGQLRLAAKPPGKQDLEPLNRYLQTQLQKLPVRVKRGRAVTPAVIAEVKPQVVILAQGSLPFTPELPGMDQNRVVQAVDVLAGKARVGERVVVVGGEMVGCETADFLADRGKKVPVTRRGEQFATKINPTPRLALLTRLAQKGVSLLPGVTYLGITPEGLRIKDKDGQEKLLEADTIVLAAGARPQDGLGKSLEGMGLEVHRAGDGVEPRSITEALAEACAIALKL